MGEDPQDRVASRRGFFREALAGLLGPLVGLLEERLGIASPGRGDSEPGPLRPPGALAGEAFAEACTACGACAEACPVQAIVMQPLPQILPARKPCALCKDTPCIAACKTSALRPTRPEDVILGLATWDPRHCLLSAGEPCDACVRACPIQGAIAVEDHTVIVDGALCAGCGTCQYYCPARPKGVVVEPF